MPPAVDDFGSAVLHALNVETNQKIVKKKQNMGQKFARQTRQTENEILIKTETYILTQLSVSSRRESRDAQPIWSRNV